MYLYQKSQDRFGKFQGSCCMLVRLFRLVRHAATMMAVKPNLTIHL